VIRQRATLPSILHLPTHFSAAAIYQLNETRETSTSLSRRLPNT
jgi:hypothetical protein